jgi:histidine phosphotransfer protein HptB
MNRSSLNEQVREYLRRRFGLPDEQIDVMMPDFKKTLAQHLSVLISAQHQGDVVGLKEAAHTMKGALLNLGFSDSAQLAQKIEKESVAGNTVIDCSLLISDIEKAVNEFIAE